MSYRTPSKDLIDLLPKGIGFEQDDDPCQEIADKIDIDIQEWRENKLTILGIKNDNMKTIYEWEKSAISKEKFILDQINGFNQNQIHLLIADRGVLFNRKFQIFNTDNPIYRKLRKNIKNDTDSLSASQKTLLNMQKTFHPVFSRAERECYLQGNERYEHLETLSAEIAKESKSISDTVANAFYDLVLYSETKIESFLSKENSYNYEVYKCKNTIYQENFSPHILQINHASNIFIRNAGIKRKTADSAPALRSILIAFDWNNTKSDLAETLIVFVITCALCPRILYAHRRGINLAKKIFPYKYDGADDGYDDNSPDSISENISNQLLKLRKSKANTCANLYFLLNELMDIFQLKNQNRQKCNAYFDRLVFGTQPRLLDEEYKKLTGRSIPLSPMTSYLVAIRDNIELCMNPDPKRLSGYKIGSPLHYGGFARFLKKYASAASVLIKHVQPNELSKFTKEYLRKDSMPVYWLDEIAQMFEDKTKDSFQNHLQEFSDDTGIPINELYQFLCSLTKNMKETNLNRHLKELKSLFTEFSAREYSIRKAKDKLYHALYDMLDALYKK